MKPPLGAIFRVTTRLITTAALCLTAHQDARADEVEDALNQQRDFNAAQTVYRSGVPHTDRQGRMLTAFDAQRSFFPIGLWGAPLPGTYYESECDWNLLKAAGFNTVWPWAAEPQRALEVGKEYGMQIVVMGEIADTVLPAVKDHPNLLGNVWMDEPIGRLGSEDMDALFAKFTAYRDRTRQSADHLPVFVNDAPWIMPPATSWWIKWNSAGDISCHDNYPVMNHTARAKSIGADPNGIPQSVALAVGDVKEQKPVWLIVGAFDQPGEYGQSFPFRYPTPEQLRACVYAGIIHGATGIVYFIWDNYVPRDGAVIGMSPNPKSAYVPNPRQEGFPHPTPATPLQLIAAKSLWETASQINKELAELTSVILSPTCGPGIAYTAHIEGKAPTATPIRTLLKPHPDGGYVLFTVNLDDAVLKVTYTFPLPLSQYQLLHENALTHQPAPETPNAFTLTYEPFDTHVIQIIPVP